MLPKTHPLIEAVTEPLSDNPEHRLSTHALLEETFDADHPDIESALNRLTSTEHKKCSTLRKSLPWVFAVIAVGVGIISYLPALEFVLPMYDFYEPPAGNMDRVVSKRTDKEKIILGDPKLGEGEQKMRLYLSDPENPAYYAEYAHVWKSNNPDLPTGYFDVVANIDPGNAFFIYFAAAEAAKDCYEKTKSVPADYRNSVRYIDGVRLQAVAREMEYTIHDRAKYEEALALIEKASRMPRFRTYNKEMMVARARIFNITTFADLLVVYSYMVTTPTLGTNLSRIADVMCARAEELSKSGNKEEFLKLVTQRDAFIKGLATNPDLGFVNELIYSVIAFMTATNFQAAAERLELTELSETFRKQHDAFQGEKDRRKIHQSHKEPFPTKTVSGYHHLTMMMSTSFVNTPPPIAVSEFEPMRRVEHEVAGGIMLLLAALTIFPAALLVFLFRFMAPKAIRLTAQRLACLIRCSDWLWVIGLGIILPIALFLIITRLTPFGGRDFSVPINGYVFPGLQVTALLLGLLMVPAFVLRRRLIKRLAPFRMPDRFGLFPVWVFTGIFLWCFMAYPLAKYAGWNSRTLYLLAAPPVMCLCFLLANALRVTFEKSSTRFVQAATALAVLPAYPVAIVTLCLLLPIYQAGEKHWLAKETLNRIDPDAPDLGAYEFKLAAQKRKETNAIMGIE